MKKTLLIFILLPVLMLLGCRDKINNYTISLVIDKKIDKNPSNSLPKDIYSLCLPNNGTDTTFIPVLSIYRLGTGDNILFDYKINNYGNAKKIKRIETAIEKNVGTKAIGVQLSKDVTSFNTNDSLSNYLSLHKEDSVLVFSRDNAQSSIVIENKEYKCYNDVNIMKKEIANLADKGVKRFTILYNLSIENVVPPNIKKGKEQVENFLRKGEYDKAQFICQQIVQSGTELNTLKPFSELLEKSADGLFDALQKAGGRNCDLIGGPMGYYVCAYELANETEKIGLKAKYDKCLSYAKAKCGLKELPSLSTTTTN